MLLSGLHAHRRCDPGVVEEAICGQSATRAVEMRLNRHSHRAGVHRSLAAWWLCPANLGLRFAPYGVAQWLRISVLQISASNSTTFTLPPIKLRSLQVSCYSTISTERTRVCGQSCLLCFAAALSKFSRDQQRSICRHLTRDEILGYH